MLSFFQLVSCHLAIRLPNHITEMLFPLHFYMHHLWFSLGSEPLYEASLTLPVSRLDGSFCRSQRPAISITIAPLHAHSIQFARAYYQLHRHIICVFTVFFQNQKNKSTILYIIATQSLQHNRKSTNPSIRAFTLAITSASRAFVYTNAIFALQNACWDSPKPFVYCLRWMQAAHLCQMLL